MTNTGKIAIGVLVGTAIGAALGLLFAPEKGSDTRKMIRTKANDLGHATGKAFAKAKELVGMKKTEEELALN